MAQQFLHSPDINSGHYQAAGKGVPEAVPSKVFDLGVCYGWLKPVPRPRQRNSLLIPNHRPCPIASSAQDLQRRNRGLVQRYVPYLPVLAAGHSKHPPRQVHILPDKPIQLAQPQPRIQRQIKLRHVLSMLLLNRFPKPPLFCGAEVSRPGIVLPPVFYEAGRILADPTALGTQTEYKGKQRAITVSCGWLPSSLYSFCQPLFDFPCRYGVGGSLSKPIQQGAASAGIIPVAALVDL